MNKKRLFQDKTVLVTGGGGGIGWGICREFAKEGARVAIVDINETKGGEVLRDILEISMGHSFYLQNIRETNALTDLVTRIEKGVGPIDIQINNAGINTNRGFLEMTEEDFDLVLDTNLKGHFFLSQIVVKRMIESQRKGVILFTSSIHQEVIQGRPHYSASKAAIAMLVKEMAAELAPFKIRVAGVAPGGIYVDERAENPKQANNEATVLLGGKNGIPRDIARAMVMLASDYWSRHITGVVLTVAGGQYLKPR